MNSKEYINYQKQKDLEARIKDYAITFMNRYGYSELSRSFVEGLIREAAKIIPMEKIEEGWHDNILIEAYENQYLKNSSENHNNQSSLKK